MLGRRAVAVVVLGALALAACGGDGGDGGAGGTTTTAPATDPERAWDAEALAVARGVARRIARETGSCRLFAPADPYAVRPEMERVGIEMPLASANCDLLEEDLEIDVFAGREEAEAWAEGRRAWLCEKAAQADVDLPGIPVVVGPRWVLLPDSEGQGRAAADAAGGRFEYASCTAGETPGWDEGAVRTAHTVANALADAGLGCEDLLFGDPDFLKGDLARQGVPVPRAFGACALTESRAQLIVYADESEIEQYLEVRQASDCEAAAGGALIPGYVVGPDWILLTEQPGPARDAASVLDGRLTPAPCQ